MDEVVPDIDIFAGMPPSPEPSVLNSSPALLSSGSQSVSPGRSKYNGSCGRAIQNLEHLHLSRLRVVAKCDILDGRPG